MNPCIEPRCLVIRLTDSKTERPLVHRQWIGLGQILSIDDRIRMTLWRVRRGDDATVYFVIYSPRLQCSFRISQKVDLSDFGIDAVIQVRAMVMDANGVVERVLMDVVKCIDDRRKRHGVRI